MYYFAYGSNMNPDRMSARGVQFESFEYGHLHHYRIRCNKISQKDRAIAFVNIEPSFTDSVFGVLYLLHTYADLTDLDRKEGYPRHYEKCFVPVYTKDGMKLALVYIATRRWTNKEDLAIGYEYKSLVSNGLDVAGRLIESDQQLYEAFLPYKTHILSW